MTEQEPGQGGPRHGAGALRADLFTTAETAEHGVDVRILRGSPTPEEIAAVTAVLTAAVVEEASHADAVVSDGPSAWARSQRIMRPSLQAGPGRWRNFSG